MFIAGSALLIASIALGMPIGKLRGLITPSRRSVRSGIVDEAMAADLLCAAISVGSSVPGALIALDDALGDESEERGLAVAARLLLMGAPWEEAWGNVPPRFDGVRAALAPAWQAGAAPVPLLERFAHSRRAARVRASREAAAELSVRLVMPLGLCFLPAFILVGVVPVIAATGLALFF